MKKGKGECEIWAYSSYCGLGGRATAVEWCGGLRMGGRRSSKSGRRNREALQPIGGTIWSGVENSQFWCRVRVESRRRMMSWIAL